ncbi:MAG: hypothetical protein JW963_03645, partial [Anaerolineales bacterium]|nr:hypothetical protein [Anaerolineales bacterium]
PAQISFSFDGTGLKLYRALYSNRGPMRVCVDGLCETVYNYSATLHWAMPWLKSGFGAGTHNVVISNTSAAYIDLDAIEILP